MRAAVNIKGSKEIKNDKVKILLVSKNTRPCQKTRPSIHKKKNKLSNINLVVQSNYSVKKKQRNRKQSKILGSCQIAEKYTEHENKIDNNSIWCQWNGH